MPATGEQELTGMAQSGIKPVYVLRGTDEFLCDTHRRELLHRLIGEADPQTCVARFDGDAELADVLDELRTLPFLAPHRVVIVSEADAFVGAHRDGLERYLQNPSTRGSLILLAASWPSNTRLYKLVAKIGEVLDCSVPDSQNLVQWITQAARRHGKTISSSAAELLEHYVGRDLAALHGELEKLALHAGTREQIQEQDIEAMVVSSVGPGAFDLTNCITRGDVAGALKALSGMLTRRGEEFKTLGMIRWHLNRVLAAKQAADAGGDPSRSLPNMPYEQRAAFLNMLRRRNTGKLLGDFRRLLRTDLAMKSGADPYAAMQQLVVGLCS